MELVKGFRICSFVFVIIVILMLLTACSASLKNLQNYENQEITIKGMVGKEVRIGSLTGYELIQGDEKLLVLSQDIPDENSKIKVKGVLVNDVVMGYYLDTFAVVDSKH